MNRFVTKIARAAALVSLVGITAACSTQQVADTTGDALGMAGRGAVKVVAGTGKLAYNGTKAAVKAVRDID
ncbi:hypothetical protein [Pseudaestuariivita sp.]|uniref:hypothetical protein n=1 Tax=Pseudaestuariivita sp. TaxID=2211669 RepID=UPI00405A1386